MSVLQKKTLALVGSLAALILAAGIIGTAAWAQQPNKIPVLIGFNRQPGPAEEALVRRAGASIKYTYHLVPAIAASLPQNAIDALRRNPNITTIEPDGLFHKIDFITDELNNTWGVKRIGAGDVHSGGNTGAGVKVAIIDSGIDYRHKDLGGCFGTVCKVAGGHDFVNNDTEPMDDDSHGTHVAGTVAANRNELGVVGVVGVAPEAKLYALKVLNANGSGSFSDVIKALEWAVANGIQITNNSYGSSGDPGSLVKAAFDNSYAAGVLHVAAAGNSGNCKGKNDTVGYPAKYASVIAVAATNQSDTRPCWSSTGPDAEISAPGVTIKSTRMGTIDGYVEFSGTSMASPHVVGVAALVLGTGAALTNAQVRQILADTATDLGAAGGDSHYGFGLVNAWGAVNAVSSSASSPAPPPDPAVNVLLTTDQQKYVQGTGTPAVLTATVTDESGTAISGLGSLAFDTKVDGDTASVNFTETATGGTYTGDLNISGLALGVHAVNVAVTDTRSVSGNGSASFTIDSGSTATFASVTAVTYATTGGKNNDKHLRFTPTISDDLGKAVSGANVSATLTNLTLNSSWSFGGSTGPDGTVTFTLIGAPSGCYRSTVTNLSAPGLTWSPTTTPENSFSKGGAFCPP